MQNLFNLRFDLRKDASARTQQQPAQIQIVEAETIEQAGFVLGEPLGADPLVRQLVPVEGAGLFFCKIFDFHSSNRPPEMQHLEVQAEISEACAQGETVVRVFHTPGVVYMVCDATAEQQQDATAAAESTGAGVGELTASAASADAEGSEP
eukprot:6788835-Prymnesium_polylepis.1